MSKKTVFLSAALAITLAGTAYASRWEIRDALEKRQRGALPEAISYEEVKTNEAEQTVQEVPPGDEPLAPGVYPRAVPAS